MALANLAGIVVIVLSVLDVERNGEYRDETGLGKPRSHTRPD